MNISAAFFICLILIMRLRTNKNNVLQFIIDLMLYFLTGLIAFGNLKGACAGLFLGVFCILIEYISDYYFKKPHYGKLISLPFALLYAALLSVCSNQLNAIPPWSMAIQTYLVNNDLKILESITQKEMLTAFLYIAGLLLIIIEPSRLIEYLTDICNEIEEDIKLIKLVPSYKSSELIGRLERIIIYVSVLEGQYTIIGFLIAAKSIARHNKLNEKSFAEFFLIGTFTSLIYASVVALIILKLTN